MKTLICTFVGLLSLTCFAAPKQKKVTIISMEIPPFMSPKLPDQGAGIYGLRHLFKKMGYDLDVRFVPIQRTRSVGMSDSKVHGFFPSFVDDDFVQGMTLSKIVYKTPWVIVERKDNPVRWKVPTDLLKYKGGNVGGYTLRSQVAEAFKNNPQALENAPGDLQNILMLANKRVDYIFIDENVFKFLLAVDPRAQAYADKLQVNPKIVALNEYGVAFKQNGASKKIMADFNKALNRDEFTKAVDEYIKKHMPTPQAKPAQ